MNGLVVIMSRRTDLPGTPVKLTVYIKHKELSLLSGDESLIAFFRAASALGEQIIRLKK